ncbi:MAG: DUF1700 domain-containing protein [Clostridia bacterium]|nr:DUF1700 domain-containing protein [Clostridia bacterium]
MNKKAFLNQLKMGLKGVPKADLDDILYDYEEHIDSALEKGKSEEEITSELGSPRKIAKQHKAEFYFNQADEKKTTGSAFKAIVAGIGLSFFNIIFVLPLIVCLYAALLSVFLGFVSVAASGLVVIVAGIIFLGFLPALAVVFVGIGLTCLGILLSLGMAWLIKIVTLGIVSYGKANIGIVRRSEGM